MRQYVFLNCAPGVRWNQNRPESVTEALFEEPFKAISSPNVSGELSLGLSFILSVLDGPTEILQETLRRLLALAVKQNVPVFIVLDGQNWWGHRPDLWNWWDKSKPGYDPKNAENVEWTGPDATQAVTLCWRNWGRQIRVLPSPNLAAPRYRDALRRTFAPLARQLYDWQRSLPSEQKFLFPGVKVGWEASIGINAYYYPGGNALREKDPADDPKSGLDMKKDFAGGLAPLGYAAQTTKGGKHSGEVTLTDQEHLVQDYLAFVARLARDAGLKREKIFTHSGGQFAPWEKHYSHRVAVNKDSLPGWSLYNIFPEVAGDLPETLKHAHRDDWCAAEWLPAAHTAEQWVETYRRTLGFRRCRSVSVYNWEGIRNRPEAREGLRVLLDSSSGSRGIDKPALP